MTERLAERERLPLERLGVAPVREAVDDQVVEDEPGGVVEHQRRDDLARLEQRPQDARNRRPRRAGHRPDDAHREDQHERRGHAPAAEVERDPARADCAEVELPFAADVEELHPEGDRRGEAREQDRRREDERRRERALGDECGVEEPAVGVDRAVARRRKHDRHGQERERDRADRNGDEEPPRLIETPLEPHSLPPAIR